MGCTRMPQGKFGFLDGSFIPDAYNNSQVDYTPMRVDLASGQSDSVREGDSVSYHYLVYNSSNFDPDSTNVDVDVYLSTNDFISTFDTKIQDHFFTWDFNAKTSVQVNATSTVPIGQCPGDYWLGIIIDETDYNTGDNDSSGWDAQPITVTEPLDSITLTRPAFANVGETVTYDVEGAPVNAPAFAYYSLSNTGSTINGHPFEIGYPVNLITTETTSSTGTWSISGVVPPALFNVKIWIEIRVDKGSYTYDSNTKTLRGT